MDSDAEFLESINALIKKEFKIDQDKLIRFYLFKLSEGRCKIFVVFFHALLDGTSIYILCRKLLQLVNLGGGDSVVNLRNGDVDDFYLLGSQIREHYGKGRDTEGQLRNDKIACWRDFFNRFEYCSISPTPDDSKSRLGKQEAFIIDGDVQENLLTLSKKLHISLFDVLFGCFVLLINKFTQQNSIAVRTSIDERLYGPQYAQTLGCFVNNLFLGVEIDADATLFDLFIASKKDKDRAIRDGLSYDSLVEHFREKVLDLARIHFNLESRGSHDLDFCASQIQTHSGQVKNDLFVELDVKKDKILGRVEYKSASFEKYFINSLIQCYANILKKVEFFLNQSIRNINILPDVHYHKVVHGFNADKCYPSAKTIHQTFEEQVRLNPNQVAVSCNGRLLTYEALNARANQLAHYLLQHDAAVPGSLIALCLEKNEQIMIAILAVFKVGAAYVPIDPHFPDDRMRYMLHETDSRIILVNDVNRSKFDLFTQQKKTNVIAIDDHSFAVNLNTHLPAGSVRKLDRGFNATG